MEEEQIILRVPDHLAAALHEFAEAPLGARTASINIEPLDDGESFWLNVNADRYPAKIVNLPTLIESHKSAEGGKLYKSGEVTRMLVVFDPAAQPRDDGGERAAAMHALAVDPTQVSAAALLPIVQDPTPGSVDLVLDDGLTPPMAHVVRRRFKRAQRYISRFSREEVGEAERVLLELMRGEAYEHVVAELVDAEDFMGPWFSGGGDNVTLVYENGVITDMYQMQSLEGTGGDVWRRSTGELDVARAVKPNADGTFGGPHLQYRARSGDAAVTGPARFPLHMAAASAAASVAPGRQTLAHPAALGAAAAASGALHDDFMQLLHAAAEAPVGDFDGLFGAAGGEAGDLGLGFVDDFGLGLGAGFMDSAGENFLLQGASFDQPAAAFDAGVSDFGADVAMESSQSAADDVGAPSAAAPESQYGSSLDLNDFAAPEEAAGGEGSLEAADAPSFAGRAASVVAATADPALQEAEGKLAAALSALSAAEAKLATTSMPALRKRWETDVVAKRAAVTALVSARDELLLRVST